MKVSYSEEVASRTDLESCAVHREVHGEAKTEGRAGYSNMGTATNVATGTVSDDGKTLTLRGEFDEPEGKVPFKNVIRMESDDLHVFESYRIFPDGRELKLIEETNARVK